VQKAYVFIKAAADTAEAVVQAIRSVPGVHDVDLVMGPDDVVVIAEHGTAEDIATMVLSELAHVQGVERTSTYLVVPFNRDTPAPAPKLTS
jgi:histidinol dehydrogenase